MGGGVISPELYDQLAEMFQWFKTQKRQAGDAPAATAARPPTRFQPHAVITNEIFPSADIFAPTKRKVQLCEWTDDAEAYEQVGVIWDAFNHTQSDIAEDTPGIIFWIDGHWILFADCDPLTERPDPPPEIDP
jgi:hypothetical protein